MRHDVSLLRSAGKRGERFITPLMVRYAARDAFGPHRARSIGAPIIWRLNAASSPSKNLSTSILVHHRHTRQHRPCNLQGFYDHTTEFVASPRRPMTLLLSLAE